MDKQKDFYLSDRYDSSFHMLNIYHTSRKRVYYDFTLLLFLAFACLGSVAADYKPAGPLKVGVFENRPIVFTDESSNITGFSIDVLESIAQINNWELEYVHGPWKTVLAKLEEGEIDLLVGIAYKPQRAEKFDFTHETLINNWGVVYRNPDHSISALDDLKGMRIALMDGSTHSREFIKLMEKFSFEFEAVPAKNYAEGLKLTAEGKADAVVINRVMSMISASNYRVLETGIIFNPVEVRFAVRKGEHTGLLDAIDEQLIIQKNDPKSVYNKSLRHWFANTNHSKLPQWVYFALLSVAGIIVILIISNNIIRRQVRLRTAELSESELRFRQLAENINELFWICSPDWKKIFYVSPIYEKIWGNKRIHLYNNPESWLQSVHKDDVEKVREDIALKASGQLNPPEMPEYRVIATDGTERWILSRAYPIRDEDGNVIRIAGIAEDITQRKKAEETIRFMAYHDSLTRLSNRHAFEYKMMTLIEQARSGNVQHVLMYIDLDQFKIVNDTCGHSAGDEMLQSLSHLLDAATSEDMTLARLGGDEFGVLIENTTLEESQLRAQRLLKIIQSFRFTWEDRIFSVGACIGLVMFGDEHKTMAELLSAADMACYAAKETGRNRLHIYNEDDKEMAQRHGDMQWVPRIKHALEEDRFILYKQPIASLQELPHGLQHREFLVRMLDENGEHIQPGAFLPAAERFELMPAIDRWVIHNVFDYLAGQPASVVDPESISFINLSGQVLNDQGFVEFILREFKMNDIPPQSICFEVTETAAIGNLKKATAFIHRLKQEGCHFALDDFGTGMSSFSYLKSLPVDFLKIDGSFILDLLDDPMNQSIVDAITRIGHAADLLVIAEWVESDDVCKELLKIGIDFAQGYGIEKPGPIDDHHNRKNISSA